LQRAIGWVIKAYGKFFLVRTGSAVLQCTVRESLKARAASRLTPVVVGDQVEVELLSNPDPAGQSKECKPHGIITEIKPRRSKFSRPKRGLEDHEQIIAANIDQMIIVSSVAQPAFKPGLIDRFLIAAFKGCLKPIVVINKLDLPHQVDLQRWQMIYQAAGVATIAASVVTRQGMEQLTEALKDKNSLMAGQSGVGKSSLLNALDQTLNLRIGEISEASLKGRHTTSAVEMHPLSFGGYVVDTPGLKYLGLWEIKAEELQNYFPEMAPFLGNCKFRNCLHQSEPSCAVKQGVAEGLIHRERYDSYLKLLQEQKTESS